MADRKPSFHFLDIFSLYNIAIFTTNYVGFFSVVVLFVCTLISCSLVTSHLTNNASPGPAAFISSSNFLPSLSEIKLTESTH